MSISPATLTIGILDVESSATCAFSIHLAPSSLLPAVSPEMVLLAEACGHPGQPSRRRNSPALETLGHGGLRGSQSSAKNPGRSRLGSPDSIGISTTPLDSISSVCEEVFS